MNPIPAPHFSGESLPERVAQLEKSLVRLIDQLNMIIPMLENRKGEQN